MSVQVFLMLIRRNCLLQDQGVLSTNYMVPTIILNPTPTTLTIHKEKPVCEFQILDVEVRFTIMNLGKPPQVCHIYCSNASFQSNNTKKQGNIEFCPISTYTQMNGLWMKKRKSHSYC